MDQFGVPACTRHRVSGRKRREDLPSHGEVLPNVLEPLTAAQRRAAAKWDAHHAVQMHQPLVQPPQLLLSPGRPPLTVGQHVPPTPTSKISVWG